MRRTTIYLPDNMKARLEVVARRQGRTEADVIRSALGEHLARIDNPRPIVPLFESRGARTNVAERVDEHLDGFGER